MTVYKKHIAPDGHSRLCTAKEACPYGGESKHFYWDGSIAERVLNPAHPLQKVINNIPSNELLQKGEEFLPPEADRASYDRHREALEMRTEEYNAQKESLIKGYPVKLQSAARTLTEMHEGAGLIAGFDLFDPDEDDFIAKTTVSDSEKLKFAKSYLKKIKAEDRFRAALSAANV